MILQVIKDKVINRNSYKMEKENFELWLAYLKTNTKPTYLEFKKFKKGKI